MKVVPLRYDVAFKKAFGQREVFNAFVQDVLGIEFESTEVHREYSYHEPIGRVKLKYDLFAEDKERRIIVELQHVSEPDFFDRFNLSFRPSRNKNSHPKNSPSSKTRLPGNVPNAKAEDTHSLHTRNKNSPEESGCDRTFTIANISISRTF